MSLQDTPSFYNTLTPMREPGQVFDGRHYAPVPESWYLAVSDIKGSTAAVETGQHSDVNFAAAAMIAVLNNLCGSIPYQFGGEQLPLCRRSMPRPRARPWRRCGASPPRSSSWTCAWASPR